MFETSINYLKETHPEESELLDKLKSIENQLDLLLSQQQNSVSYDPTSYLSKIRIVVYNTYADQDFKSANTLFSHVAPSRYTLYIKIVELDKDNKVVDSPNSALFLKYFNSILIDTPSGVVVWDREQVLNQKEQLFNPNVKYYSRPVKPKTNVNDNDSVKPNNKPNNSYLPERFNPPEVNKNEPLEIVLSNLNGFDELHLNRLGYEECDVHIYFFPVQLLPVYSVTEELFEFIKLNSDSNSSPKVRQASLPRITRAIWVYGIKQKLFDDKDPENVTIELDDTLKKLLKLNSNSIPISEIPKHIKKHLLPPKPIKIIYQVKLKGTPKESESVYDITLESSFEKAYKKIKIPTDLDNHILNCENELIELIHLRNLYSAFSENPHKFITTFTDNKNLQNFKPFIPPEVERRSYYREPWVHYAIENYLYSNNRNVHDFITRIMERTPTDPPKRQ